jgi:hypothetical protein
LGFVVKKKRGNGIGHKLIIELEWNTKESGFPALG